MNKEVFNKIGIIQVSIPEAKIDYFSTDEPMLIRPLSRMRQDYYQALNDGDLNKANGLLEQAKYWYENPR